MCKTCGCPAGGNAQIKLYLKGYSSSNVKNVERHLLGLPGVYHVHIHAHDGQTTIDYNPARTTLNDITGVLSEHGLQALF